MGKAIDLTNQIFGKLTVLERDWSKKNNKQGAYWFCKCSCGNPNLVSIRGSNLRNGHTTTCGMCDFYKILGQRFGKLVVIANGTKTGYALCQCDCNNTCEVTRNHLLKGHTRSCGCLKIEQQKEKMIGRRYGKLTVLEDSGRRDYKQTIIWRCLCDCGNITYANTDILNKGEKKSCGCLGQSCGERQIEELLKAYAIPYQKEYALFGSKTPRGGVARFDFCVHGQYIIEFDGRQHFYSKNSGWDTEEHLQNTRQNDYYKNRYCFDNHIPLIRIPYHHLEQLTIEDLLPETSKYLLTPENEEQYYDTNEATNSTIK